MSMPFICPVCGGEGTIPNDGVTADATRPICYHCGGSGWVSVSSETPVFYNPPQYYWNRPNSIPNGDFNKPQ